jgi:hypothetical protein
MNTLAEIGVQIWRNHRALPGAKTEISASVVEFFDDQGPVLRVVIPSGINQAPQILVDQFLRAIEIVAHWQCEKKSLKLIQDFHATPVLILSETLASTLEDSALISTLESDTVKVGADPQKVFTTPMLKAEWWNLIMKMMKKMRS